MPAMTFLNKIQQTIEKYRLLAKNDRVVVAVSGGPDSVALLYALNYLKKHYKLSLCVAHLDHMLRKASGEDRRFTERLAHSLSLPVISGSADVARSRSRGSLEEAARKERLDFLFRVARETKADVVALGHNLDDQAETVLMRIIRGAGLYGLSAISPRRKISGFVVIRPLIEVRRAQIESFLRSKKIKARLDKTNRQDIFLRNRIRKRLLPLLEKEYNKNIKSVLSTMADTVGSDYEYLCLQAERVLGRMGRGIDLTLYGRLHKALQRMVVRLCIARLKGDTRRVNFRHILEIEDLAFRRPENSIVNLPGGIVVAKKRNRLKFYIKH